MRKFVFLFVLLSTIKSSVAQSTDIVVIPKDDIRTLLVDIMPSLTKRSVFRLSDRTKEGPSKQLLERLFLRDTFLKKEDIEFISLQVTQMTNLNWDSTLIDSASFIKANDIDSIFKNFRIELGWTLFHKTYGADYFQMSLPYFTIDKQICLIYISNHCGRLCGSGSLRIYKKYNDAWTLLKTIGGWVS